MNTVSYLLLLYYGIKNYGYGKWESLQVTHNWNPPYFLEDCQLSNSTLFKYLLGFFTDT